MPKSPTMTQELQTLAEKIKQELDRANKTSVGLSDMAVRIWSDTDKINVYAVTIEVCGTEYEVFSFGSGRIRYCLDTPSRAESPTLLLMKKAFNSAYKQLKALPN